MVLKTLKVQLVSKYIIVIFLSDNFLILTYTPNEGMVTDNSINNLYTKSEIDTTFLNHYLKTEINNNIYTKTEIDTNIYTKTQLDTKLLNHYLKTEIDTNIYNKTEIDTNIYTKSQLDTTFLNHYLIILFQHQLLH